MASGRRRPTSPEGETNGSIVDLCEVNLHLDLVAERSPLGQGKSDAFAVRPNHPIVRCGFRAVGGGRSGPPLVREFDCETGERAQPPRVSAGRCNWRSWKRLEFVHPASCVLQPPPTECHCKSSGVWGRYNCYGNQYLGAAGDTYWIGVCGDNSRYCQTQNWLWSTTLVLGSGVSGPASLGYYFETAQCPTSYGTLWGYNVTASRTTKRRY